MSFFHLRTLPGCAWPALPDSVFAPIWNAYLELDSTQWLDRAVLEERQLDQARTLLAHCLVNVPYYRATLPAAGIEPDAIRTMDDYRRVPLLSRRDYQEKVSTQLATSLPRGTVAEGTAQTSGSSGTPTNVYTTNRSRLWWYAFYLRDLEWCDIDPTGTLAAIRSSAKTGPELQMLLQGVSLPNWLPALDRLIQMGPSHGMDIRQDPRVQLQWLRRIAPDYLLSFSTNLETLALLARQEGPLPGLRSIQAISAMLTPETQATIEAAFGVPVKNTYSCAEMGYLASGCPEGHGLHVHAENVILEVLDEQGSPCKPGQTGRVFVTHLHNLRGPFVRYELGDEATVGPASCPCGRGLPLLTHVQGKIYPMFRLPVGRLKHTSVLATFLRRAGGHWQHQVIQKAVDHVVVRLAVDSTWTEKRGEDIRRIVHDFFEKAIRVDIEIHDRLSLPSSGKFQSMINEIPP
jgi:phenylacetate-CoA ligase